MNDLISVLPLKACPDNIDNPANPDQVQGALSPGRSELNVRSGKDSEAATSVMPNSPLHEAKGSTDAFPLLKSVVGGLSDVKESEPSQRNPSPHLEADVGGAVESRLSQEEGSINRREAALINSPTFMPSILQGGKPNSM